MTGRRLALGNFKELNLIIKGDVDGSVEALSDLLQKLSTEEIAVYASRAQGGRGHYRERRSLLKATASDAVIVGFNVRPSPQALRLAENEGVEIKTYSIIYNAIEEIKSAMEGMLEPKIQEKIIANVEVRNVFKFGTRPPGSCCFGPRGQDLSQLQDQAGAGWYRDLPDRGRRHCGAGFAEAVQGRCKGSSFEHGMRAHHQKL